MNRMLLYKGIFSVFVGLFLVAQIYAYTTPEIVSIQVLNNHSTQTTIFAELAESSEERKIGLSYRNSIGIDEGMLFVFKNDGFHSFWMKDMNFPLDIIWLDKEQTVIHIEQAVSPDSFPQSFSPQTPARYVLEVKANAVETLGIEIGTQLDIDF